MSGIVFAFAIVLLMVIFAFGLGVNNYASQNDFQDYLENNNNTINTYDESGTGYDDEDYYNEDYYDDDDEDYYDEDYDDDDGEDDSELDYEYIFPNSDSERLTEEMVSSLSKSDIRLAINEIYARHGRKFSDKSLQEYFDKKGWYSGTVDAKNFDEGVFNKIKKYNIQFLSKYR